MVEFRAPYCGVEEEADLEDEEEAEQQPEYVTYTIEPVNDTYGTNDRAGVEVVARADDGRSWAVVTLIPGKRIRLHPVAAVLGFQADDDNDNYPGIKQV